MNRSDFDKWLHYHQSLFDRVKYWLMDIDDRDPLIAWFDILGELKPDELRKASAAMLSGELPEPRNASEHPRTLAAWIKRERYMAEAANAATEFDGQYYKCVDCMDAGNVPIWGPRAIRAAASGRSIPRDFRAVRCHCRKKHAKEPDTAKYYDQDKHCSSIEHDEDGLIEFVKRKQAEHDERTADGFRGGTYWDSQF